jgi:hypothetical protein
MLYATWLGFLMSFPLAAIALVAEALGARID